MSITDFNRLQNYENFDIISIFANHFAHVSLFHTWRVDLTLQSSTRNARRNPMPKPESLSLSSSWLD